jgi:hypothetical protein
MRARARVARPIAGGPVGTITRGTTSPRRLLRRVDRWLTATHPRLLATRRLLAVDLGFGARPFTTLELAARLRRLNPAARVVGLETDLDRVAAAAPDTGAGVEFAVGGFAGWALLDGPGRWRRGEVTVKWDAVRPIGR